MSEPSHDPPHEPRDNPPRDPPQEAPGRGHPAAFHFGAGHVIVHATPPFVELYGREVVGLPAREVMVDLPVVAFELMDRVLADGRPLARRIRTSRGVRRLVVAPRRDPDGEVYGVTTHLVEPSPAR